jgi:hypothetical protein
MVLRRVRQQYRKRIMQSYVTKALETQHFTTPLMSKTDSDIENVVSRLEAWDTCVSEFTNRTIHNPSDKLPAIATIASILIDRNTRRLPRKNIEQQRRLQPQLGTTVCRPKTSTRIPSTELELGKCRSLYGVLAYIVSGNALARPGQASRWIERYGLKLISCHMIYKGPMNPYVGVVEGFTIVIGGSCVGLKHLSEYLKDDHTFSQIRRPRYIANL